MLDALRLGGNTLRQLGSVLGGLLETLEVKAHEEIRVGSYVRVQLLDDDYREAREAVDRASKAGQPLPEHKISLIVEYRSQRRDEQDWAAADAIRTWLADRGVIVDDTARGARWWLKTSGP